MVSYRCRWFTGLLIPLVIGIVSLSLVYLFLLLLLDLFLYLLVYLLLDLLQVTLMTGATSYQDAWARSIGARSSLSLFLTHTQVFFLYLSL